MSTKEPEDTKYLKLAGGRVVNGSTGETVVDNSINRQFSVGDMKGANPKPTFDNGTRRYLDDLRMPPHDSRPYAIVLSYSLFGLSDADIAFILGTDVVRVQQVRESKEYAHLLDSILQNVREHDKSKVRKVLNDAAGDAAKAIVNIAKDKLHSKQFAAAQDILNRTGHSADVGTEDKKQGGIVIRIIDDRDAKASAIDVGDL